MQNNANSDIDATAIPEILSKTEGLEVISMVNTDMEDDTDDEGLEEPDGDWEDYEFQRLTVIHEIVGEWGQEWSITPEFELLTEVQRGWSGSILRNFVEYMLTYHDCPPQAWNTVAMEECCLETLPRKISAERSYFQSMAPVLASFFRYLAQCGTVSSASRMASRILAIALRIVSASDDPSNWGMAKTTTMAAMEEGVDLANPVEYQAFIMRYNERLVARNQQRPQITELGVDDVYRPAIPYNRLGAKVGRNDPCICGSGKKYKKCCGTG